MIKTWFHWISIVIGLITFSALTGCGIGYNYLLFVTKTNMGVDIDTTPPAAEISIARQEGVLAPTFEQGKTLNVLASFNTDLNGFQRLLFGTSSAFSVGDAAYLMGNCFNKESCNVDIEDLKLSAPPTKRKSWFGSTDEDVEYLGPGMVNPVFFGTHSTFGLKIEWNGTTGQYPSALKLGYHRKELAWAPVSMSRPDTSGKCGTNGTPETSGEEVCVNVPSLIATLDNNANVGTFDETGIDYLQYFATGKAATELVRHKDVRKVLMKKILPDLAQIRTTDYLDDK